MTTLRTKSINPPEPLTAMDPDAVRGMCGNPRETLSCLLKTVEDLNSAPDLATGLERVAGRLQGAIAFDVFAILLLDELGQELRFHYAVGIPEQVADHWRFGLGQGLVGEAAATGQVQKVDDVGADPRYIAGVPELRSEVAVPLISKGQVIGVLDVGSFKKNFFPAAGIRDLEFVANHLAAAIERQRLYANLKQQTRILSALHEASRELTSILDRRELLESVADLVRRQIDHTCFSVMLWSEERQGLETVYARGDVDVDLDDVPLLALGQGLCGTAAALRQSVRVPNVSQDPRFEACVITTHARSELVVPLLFKERLVGVLDVLSDQFNAFSAEHESFLATLASYVAIALENSSLYERVRLDEKRLASDLDTARTIQQYLLPKQTPYLPGVQLAASYLPARQLGGDFYDFLTCPRHTLVAVGDIAGKGTAAALYGSLVLGLLRGYGAENCLTPADTMRYLNDELQQLQIERRFVALTLAMFNPEQRVMRIANAGLPYPLLVRDGEVRELTLPGLPIGAMARDDFEELVIELQPGDTVVFATDGIEEFRNGRGETFGSERLYDVLARFENGTAREIADGLLKATSTFLGSGSEPSDDRTLVAFKLTE